MTKEQIIAYILGYFMTVVNVTNVAAGLFSVCRQFLNALHAEKRIEIKYHFRLLIFCFGFFAANCLALYAFYDSWIVDKNIFSIDIMTNRFGDRIYMCICQITLCSIVLMRGYAYKDKPDED